MRLDLRKSTLREEGRTRLRSHPLGSGRALNRRFNSTGCTVSLLATLFGNFAGVGAPTEVVHSKLKG